MLITLRGLGLSYRSQKMPKCGKNKKVAHKVKQIVMLIFLPDFLVFFCNNYYYTNLQQLGIYLFYML